jgi:membrane fusion protein (multidrug efflux system)
MSTSSKLADATEIPVAAEPTRRSAAEKEKRASSQRRFILIGLAVVMVVGGIAFYLVHRGKESTDDAFLDAHIIQISPEIAERVNHVAVTDNQFVKKGDLLVELDSQNEVVLLETAKANLASSEAKLVQAQAQLEAATSDLAQSRADVKEAQATADNAAKDLARNKELKQSGAIAQREFDTSQTQALSSKAAYDSKRQSALSAEAQVRVAGAQVKAAEASAVQAQAILDSAELRLSYTKIFAPADGRVTRKNVEPGSYVQTGAALLAIVPPETWVIANFKETQLDEMRPGQPVDIRIDAYPSLDLHGRVESIQSGTGSRFSLLPSENATGNFVKVVQRVPVKIVFTDLPKDAPEFSPGMSVVPTVHVDQPGRAQ